MRDHEIRTALDARLFDTHHEDVDTLIRHELGICAGNRRIDVAVVNGEIAGYEIKSDKDTLARLAGQAEAYGNVLDRAILVTTRRHLDDGLEKLPEWWGIMLATEVGGCVCLDVIREPGLNSEFDAFALAQLLWRDEALEELRAMGKGKGLSRKARHYVWLALSEAVELDELRSIVRSRLKGRPEWPGGQLRGQGDATHQTTAS